jgi:hypothetical protein
VASPSYLIECHGCPRNQRPDAVENLSDGAARIPQEAAFGRYPSPRQTLATRDRAAPRISRHNAPAAA